jgi:MFS family permease
MFQALRIRDFRLLWGGSLVSGLGSWLLILAIPAHVFLVTGSLRDTGLTLAAQYLPVGVLGPVAGVLTDRWDRRRLMISTSLFRARAVASMLLGTSPGRYWVLYVALIAESSGGVLYVPAMQAHTPAIVGTGTLLSSANSLSAFTGGAVQIVGAPLGGILLASYGVKWLIGADAVSYLLSASAMVMTSRTDGEHAGQQTTISDVARDLGAGWRVLRSQPVARALLPVTVLFLAANASLSAMLIPPRGPAAGRQPGRRGRGLLPAVHLLVAHHRTARRGSHRHVRLDVRGHPADRRAARDPQRRPRPGQRRLPHRRGRGHPHRRRSRPVPRPGCPSHRPRRRQPPDPRRACGPRADAAPAWP